MDKKSKIRELGFNQVNVNIPIGMMRYMEKYVRENCDTSKLNEIDNCQKWQNEMVSEYLLDFWTKYLEENNPQYYS